MNFYQVLICGLMVLSFIAGATESDDFPPADGKTPESSTSEIDRLVQDIFQEFVKKHNESDPGCDKKHLMKVAILALDQNFSWAGRILEDHQDGKQKYRIGFFSSRDRAETVYKGTNIKGCCSRAVNLDGIRIGIDKIDHFFGNGGIL